LALGRTMTRYDTATFLADGKHMIDNLATVMAVLMICSVMVGLLVTVLLFRHRSVAAAWLALGLVLMVAVVVVTLSVEVPIDNKIRDWTVATLPSDWEDIRSRWAAFHTLRTFLSLGAVTLAVAAALVTRPARGHHLTARATRPPQQNDDPAETSSARSSNPEPVTKD
jgi:hypothetical protein